MDKIWTMDNIGLYYKISLLPENLREEVEIYVNSLENQSKRGITTKPRIFGSLKGQIKMSDDFDAPLEEFKDYM